MHSSRHYYLFNYDVLISAHHIATTVYACLSIKFLNSFTKRVSVRLSYRTSQSSALLPWFIFYIFSSFTGALLTQNSIFSELILNLCWRVSFFPRLVVIVHCHEWKWNYVSGRDTVSGDVTFAGVNLRYYQSPTLESFKHIWLMSINN